MDVIECGNRVAWVTKIPNIDGRVLVIVISDDKLSWNLRIPHHLSFFRSTWLLCLLTSKVVIHTSGARGWLGEVEDRLVDFEVPNDNFAVFTGTG